jgi:hypothetical protein
MEVSEYIPVEKFNLWYSLFKKSSGRFLFNPIYGKKVYVSYYFDDVEDCNNFSNDYLRLTTTITESKRSFLKKIKLKLGLV